MNHSLKQYFTKPTEGTWYDLHALPEVDGGYVMYVYKRNARRSLPQNATYWMWLKNLEEDTGEAAETYHEWFRRMFNAQEIIVNKMPITVGASTTKLKKKEFTEYLEKIQQYVIQDMGLSPDLVPWPSEMGMSQLAAAEHLNQY